MLSDAQLLVLLDTKPEKGMKKLSQIYGGLVYTIVRGRLSGILPEQDVEECVCDVLFEAYEKRESITLQGGTIKGWLALCAKRRAIDRCRRALRAGELLSLDAHDMAEPESGEDLQSDFELSQLQDALLREIQALGRPDREILIRKYYYRQSAREIAKALSMKENTVDQRARRALQKLRSSESLQSLKEDGYGA